MPELCLGTHSEAEIIRATTNGVQGDQFERRRWNVEGTRTVARAEDFWRELVFSLLGAQQRYRKGSLIERLENGVDEFPFPLSIFGSLSEHEINERLRHFRFQQRITKQLIRNHGWLFGDGEGWATVQTLLDGLLQQRNILPDPRHKDHERMSANALLNKLGGLGPKQARNLLQSLGLTRYEIPLDSRVVDWLRERLGWNIWIEALARIDYYEDLLDRVQASCAAAGVLPTVFDAAAFFEMEKRPAMKVKPTTCTGYVNRNGQVVVRNTGAPGTDNNQYVYQLACSHCGNAYGTNGSDIFQRKCPKCQDGQPGLDYGAQ